jgi:hypothetical protein
MPNVFKKEIAESDMREPGASRRFDRYRHP